jgi:peroxiredoxin
MSLALVSALTALWIIVLLQGLIVLGLVRTLGEIRSAAENGRLPQRLPVGARAPRLQGVDVRTELEVDTADLAGRAQVILFLSHNCPYCWRLADGTNNVPAEPLQSRIAVCYANVAKTREFASVLAADVALLADPDGSMFASFGISSTPSTIMVDDLGIVRGSGGPRHSGELADLISSVREPAGGSDRPIPVVGT